MLGLHEFGPLVNVEQSAPPYGNSRRLIADADVNNNANRAHSGVVPGGNAMKGPDGKLLHEEVWKYLFTHPADEVSSPVPADPNCRKDLR